MGLGLPPSLYKRFHTPKVVMTWFFLLKEERSEDLTYLARRHHYIPLKHFPELTLNRTRGGGGWFQSQPAPAPPKAPRVRGAASGPGGLWGPGDPRDGRRRCPPDGGRRRPPMPSGRPTMHSRRPRPDPWGFFRRQKTLTNKIGAGLDSVQGTKKCLQIPIEPIIYSYKQHNAGLEIPY